MAEIDTNSYKDRVRTWVEDCDKLHAELIGFHKVLLAPAFAADTNCVLQDLSTSCLRATGSVLILIENARHWDAELILRSVQEGTVKYLYLLSDPSCFADRADEYSVALFEVSSLKTHDRALQLIVAHGSKGDKAFEALADVILPQNEYDALAKKYPSADRSRVEGRWGFTQLIQKLRKSQSRIADLLPSLLHGYGMASHLQHMDAVGIGMVHERDSRPEPRRSSAHLAQTARILTDCNVYTLLRLVEAYGFAGEPTSDIWAVWDRHATLQKDFQEAQREWTSIEFS